MPVINVDRTIPDSVAPPILLVEDNHLNQNVLTTLLHKFGYNVRIANNGIEAVEAVMSDTFPLILMDCHMPQMDGFEAASQIRRLEADKDVHTPIVAVTAVASIDKDRCLAAGMDDYIAKPIDIKAFKACIEHWIRKDMAYHNQKLREYLQEYSPRSFAEQKAVIQARQPERCSIVDGDPCLSFAARVAELLERLNQALLKEEADAIAYLAYEIRSSAVAFGAKPLARLCLYLEAAVKDRDWAEARSVMQATQRAFDTLRQDLEKQAGDKVLS